VAYNATTFNWLLARSEMTTSYETKFIDVQEALLGFGDTRDLAFNDLLEKLRLFELDIG
jgi:hypothetical protein